VVAINNDTTATTVSLPPMTLGVDVLKACAAPVAAAGGITLTIPARTSCVF
jgi:hypothetical protein